MNDLQSQMMTSMLGRDNHGGNYDFDDQNFQKPQDINNISNNLYQDENFDLILENLNKIKMQTQNLPASKDIQQQIQGLGSQMTHSSKMS